MFAASLLKAVRTGYVTGDIYMKAALDGCTLMTISFAQPRPHDGSLA
jgi:unsaturated rhamnogalacturonyl hydrolase